MIFEGEEKTRWNGCSRAARLIYFCIKGEWFPLLLPVPAQEPWHRPSVAYVPNISTALTEFSAASALRLCGCRSHARQVTFSPLTVKRLDVEKKEENTAGGLGNNGVGGK